MNREEIIAGKSKIISANGPWSAHNIRLAKGVYTIKEGIAGDEYKLRRIIQAVSDISRKPFDELKILDLACLEGLYGIECAKLGARVTALDIRQANITKVEFAKNALGLSNLETVRDDVRNISVEKYGKFDVILCLGIFYHLDSPDLSGLIKSIHSMSSRLAIFDTHISLSSGKKYTDGGHIFYGKRVIEHAPSATKEEKEKDLWKSIDNQYCFHLTKESLVKMLQVSGFQTVTEVLSPSVPAVSLNRITLAAIKGEPMNVDILREYDSKEQILQQEINFTKKASFHKTALWNSVMHNLRAYTPRPLKKLAKKAINIKSKNLSK